MSKATLPLAALVLVIGAALVIAPTAQAQDPIGGALATLAAATAQAEQVKAAQRATVAALSAEATRQAQRAAVTAQAQSAAATQSAVDDLNRQRAATATAQAQSIAATATSQALTIAAEGTRQAIDAQERAQLARTYAERQARFTFGLLVVEIGAIVGALWLLWKLARTLSAWADKMRPQAEPRLADLIDAAQPAARVVIDATPAEPTEPRMPDFVQVVDNPQMVDAISQWAERFDTERGASYGN